MTPTQTRLARRYAHRIIAWRRHPRATSLHPIPHHLTRNPAWRQRHLTAPRDRATIRHIRQLGANR